MATYHSDIKDFKSTKQYYHHKISINFLWSSGCFIYAYLLQKHRATMHILLNIFYYPTAVFGISVLWSPLLKFWSPACGAIGKLKSGLKVWGTSCRQWRYVLEGARGTTASSHSLLIYSLEVNMCLCCFLFSMICFPAQAQMEWVYKMAWNIPNSEPK